jgi:DNA mismatch repair protein MutL
VSRIVRLPEQVVNQIAAGEVVERPASVVKELLENALDAGALRVTVELKDAGRRLVRVVDDGGGMTAGELELALERHATSKIASGEDLLRIRSLGFRGEALPAICAVSRFRLSSRARGAPRGAAVRGEGGLVRERGPADCAEGTSVEVADLFFNTPARLKFLKSPQAELAAALRVLTHLALTRLGLHLEVIKDGRPFLTLPGARSLRERVGALRGHDLAGRLLGLDEARRGITVGGLLGPPALARGHRDDMVILVNGRPVRDTALLQTVLEAYRPLLARDQFPVLILALEVPPEDVDVNVHPTKAWVRFRHPRLIQDAVFAAVQRALRAPGVVGSPRPEVPAAVAGAAGAWPPTGGEPALFAEEAAPYGPSRFGAVVGQLQETFIVCANEEEVFFVDQHVAHERVLFERLRADLAAAPLPSQELLFPLPLELPPAGRARLEEWLPTLGRLGFELEGFGGGTLLLRAVPALLKGEEPRRLVEALVDEVGGPRADSVPLLDRALAFVACRAAVKAHAPLDRGEMARLLADLSGTAAPFFCPHGRPIVSRLSLREIRRELRRTW